MNNIFLKNTIKSCKEQFENIKTCPKNLSQIYSEQCQECLRISHFEDNNLSYQCPKSTFVYVCKYANKYASETYNLFKVLFKNISYHTPNILSFGAGPATELFALNQLINDKIISSYSYTGIDNNSNWQPIWEIIQNNNTDQEDITFQLNNAEQFIQNYDFKQTDIILFNYMISDFAKYASKQTVKKFLLALKEKLSQENPNTIILFNDINLDFPFDANKGATHLLKDCFEPTYKRVFKQFYKNNKKTLEEQFSYEGTTPMNENNNLIFDCSEDTKRFNPYESMSAIQMILKKG
jgi:hypothetical protein